MNSPKTYVGIDPGQKGGIAFIEPRADHATTFAMPMAGKEIDVSAITELFAEWTVGKVIVVIEKVHAMPKQGVVSTFKFGFGTGVLHGIVRTLGFPLHLVTPQKWKKVVLEGTSKDKAAAIDFCKRIYPDINLLATKRSRVPHDGMADALCIARYAEISL